jgi:hypothetical protein
MPKRNMWRMTMPKRNMWRMTRRNMRRMSKRSQRRMSKRSQRRTPCTKRTTGMYWSLSCIDRSCAQTESPYNSFYVLKIHTRRLRWSRKIRLNPHKARRSRTTSRQHSRQKFAYQKGKLRCRLNSFWLLDSQSLISCSRNRLDKEYPVNVEIADGVTTAKFKIRAGKRKYKIF